MPPTCWSCLELFHQNGFTGSLEKLNMAYNSENTVTCCSTLSFQVAQQDKCALTKSLANTFCT